MVDWNRRARIAESILETAGMTPMVRLRCTTAHEIDFTLHLISGESLHNTHEVAPLFQYNRCGKRDMTV